MKYAMFASTLTLGLALAGCAGDPNDVNSAGTADPGAGPSPAASSGLTLTAGGAAARCAQPEAEFFKDAEVVFEGTVTSVTDVATTEVGTVDASVTITVTHTFRGEPGATVRLRQDGGNPDAVSYREGQTYLITAGDGGVWDCLSGTADSPELAESYEQAFGPWRKQR
ncbi:MULTISPECIES: hypothetical protein [Actinoplanes]|uniref:hypothetical protein n=1 Tax=Actinoplanes TaxID=1865 RepID=UPI0005F297BD|nr:MULTISPECIES: hypothetical protein [Actinoplanes]GLY06358.1 hypothetical protein Acsp01_67370 [Actinoplanes sp. NBRC 101535]